MLALHISLPIACFFLACAALLAFALAFRSQLRERFASVLGRARPIVTIACVPIGFWLMEAPYNTILSQMRTQWMVLSLVVLALIYAVVYFLGQRTKGAMVAFLVACFVSGVANHFVAQFKGQPVLPSDVLAIHTAASVGGGYEYAIDNTLAFCIAVMLAAFAAIAVVPSALHTRKAAIANTALGASALAVCPTIIAIMNETYSDISTYPQLAESYGGPIPFSTYEGTIATGDVYVSAMGGGTCNSEFEFLTGSSMGLLGPGVYPYMLYNLEGVDNMASYLKSIGYATSAIHPADAQNWRRDRVYEQLGFDEFFDITSFDGAEYFRDMVSDGATYDKILQIMDEGEGPQFIFNVTIANHGGYDTGTIAEEDMMRIDMGGEDSAEVNEYVTAIARADADLAAFLAKLAQREEPIVVVLFGDHQPGFVEQLAPTGDSDEEPTVDDAQQRYVTPYMLWTNDEQLSRHVRHGGDTSLNYLAATTLKTAGLPLNEYFAFLYATKQSLPAINLNGYMDAEGVWRWNDDADSSSAEAVADLAIVQHQNLFDNKQ